MSTAPDFRLPDTDGAEHGPDGVTVVVFTCNHCPYALAWHERLLAVATDYADRGVRTLLINPNDAERYPRDSLDAMRERVASEGPWPAPYLRDSDQAVARAYGAQTTPDVFVLDAERRVRYRGAPTQTTATSPPARSGCATPWTPCSTVVTPIPPRQTLWAAR